MGLAQKSVNSYVEKSKKVRVLKNIEKIIERLSKRYGVKPSDIRNLALALGILMVYRYARDGMLLNALKDLKTYILIVDAATLYDIDIVDTDKLLEAVKKVMEKSS